MKDFGKRAIALLLVLIFMVGMIPTAAFATDVEGEEVEEIHSHVWGDWYLAAAPTCTEEGILEHDCSICGESETESVPASGHTWGEGIVTAEPTCTEEGSREYVCSACGETASETIPALGHAWGEGIVTVEPTCTEDGTREYVCSVCGETASEAIPALGHTLGEWVVTQEPTCTEEGSREQVCSACGETVVEAIPALGHTLGEWVVTKEPTCTEEGVREQVCSVCGETVSEAIPALGHTLGEWVVTKEPTCTEEGSKEQVCSVCNETVVEAIPALGHDWGEWEITKEPTCEDKGEHKHVCKVCGAEETEEVEAKGHDWTEDNGVDLVKCKVCGLLKIIADGGSFDLEFDGDNWVIMGDPYADVEGPDTWDSMFQGVALTGNWANDLVTIAQTQVGYHESTANYALSTHSVRNGYTRYGGWYGIPYGDWCAMFISFCMNYAGISSADMPYDSGCPHWIETLNSIGRFGWNGSYDPKVGDLIFYDDGDGLADHVGIVHWIDRDNAVIHTIEGNLYDSVSYNEVYRYSDAIVGYGILPENPAAGKTASALVEKTLIETVEGKTITVSGMLPEDAKLSVVAVPLDAANEILNAQAGDSAAMSEVVFAFDVTILSDGKKFDLEEYGESVTVTISDVAEEITDIVHVKIDVTDGNGGLDEAALNEAMTVKQESETLAPTAEGDAVFFDLTSCSLLMGTRDIDWPQALIDRARDLYDDTVGSEHPVEVYVTGPEDDTQMAGDTLTYTIKYLLANSANWGGSPYSGTETLFDNYRNAYLEIKLPAGLFLQDADLQIASADPNDRDLTVPHTYRLKLSDVLDPSLPEGAPPSYIAPSSAKPTTCDITVFIGNNGTENAITTTNYDLSDMVTLHAEFDIVNKLLSPSDPDYVVATYSKTATADGHDFGTTSPDVWSVVKANASGSPSYSLNTNPKTVTFTWEIGVGLLDNNNNLITDTSKYTRLGRDAVTSVTLKDTLSAVFSKNGSSVNPMTVKIQKEGAAEVDISNKIGQELTVWGDGVDPALAALTLATQQNAYIDSDGDGRGDKNPPIYTKYTVTATYEITDDMIADFHSDVYNITAKNEADTKATLERIPNVQEGHGEDTKPAPLVSNSPASLQISKTLRKYGSKGNVGSDVPYTGTNVIYGNVTYTLTATDGNIFTVYKYNNNRYEPFAEDVTSATLTAGDVYYLDAGRDFYVTENIDPNYANAMKFVSVTPADSADPTRAKFTATVGPATEVKFLNKECKGYVVVNKNDGNPSHKLSNAVFTLTPVNGGEPYTLTTVDGVASVDFLPYGTYRLEEQSAPDGYAKQDDENGLPMTIVIGDGTNEAIKYELTFKNLETKAKIELKKYVGITQASTDDFTLVSSTEGLATFALHRKDYQGNNDTVITTDYKGDPIPTTVSGGVLSAEVPAEDPDGHPYTYYFVETLSESGAANYYPVNKAGLPIDPAASSEVQLVDEDGKVQPATVNMYNRQNVAVQVFKNFYHYTTAGVAQTGAVTSTSGSTPSSASMTIPVTLYRWDGTGATDGSGNPASASQLENLGTKNAKSSSTQALWESLPAYGSNGIYTYYVLEDLEHPTGNPDHAVGYSFDSVDTSLEGKTIVEIGGQRYVKIDFNTAKATYQARLNNYQKAVPVHVLKKNSITNATSVTGCRITVYTDPECTQIARDAQTGKELNNQQLLIPNNGTGATFFLEEGKTYYYKETTVASGFKFDRADTDVTSVTVENGGVIKFDSVNHGSVQYKSYTIYNEPQPQLRINKKNAADTSSNMTGAEFTVYVKNTTTGEYVTYPIGGTPTVITRTNANSGVRVLPSSKLPAGYEGYYFHESKVPSGYLNPNSQTARDEYARLDTTNEYIYDSASGKTFVKGVVADLTGTSDTQTFTFYNIPMTGNLTVQKTVYGATQRTSGFNVVVTGSDGSTKQAKTDSNGVATFENLPVYDNQGNKITYTITEGDPSTWDGDLAETYYKVKDGQTVKLEAGKTTSKDAENKPLTVDNARYIQISATKYRQNGYMSTHGSAFGYPMNGVTIGLYRQLEGETTWKPVLDSNDQPITGETAQGGNISFDKLPRTDDTGKKYSYALVELNSNSDVYLPYQGTFKQTPTPGATLDSLTPYNAVTLDAADITNTLDEYDLDDLMNSSHWVQFHVTKLLDDTSLTDNLEARAADPTLPIDEQGHHTQIDANDKPLSDCIFSLYRYVLTDADIAAGSVAFNKDTWAYLGTYSSGTLLNQDDKILAGQFLTVIDEGLTDANGDVVQGVNERYVYMLVEDSVGPNSAIPNPHFQNTFWHHTSTTVTCPQASQSLGYDLDTVNHGDVLNSWDEGPGPGNIILAALRLSKWADEPDDNGNMIYKPLENATFEVSLPDGSVIAHLTSSRGVNPRKDYAYAQTGVYQLVFDKGEDEIADTEDDKIWMREYEVEGGEPNDYDVTDYVIEQQVQIGDKTGNVYLVPVSVRETGAPEGYGFSMLSFETYMVFCDKDPGTTGNSFRFFSDLFLTKTDGRSDFELAQDHAGEPHYYAVDADANSTLVIKDHDQLRIVDRLTVNTSVGVHKVGYVPVASGEGSTLGKNSQQIATGNYGAHGLYGVTMTLERYDTVAKQWKPWNADEDNWGTSAYTFSTNRDGDASFTNGLPQGEYRIKETGIGSENSAYENAYPGTGNRYRTFTVGPVPMIVYMANPEKIDFSLKKTDMDGNALGAGFKFKLGSSERQTNGDGIVTWTDLATGKYTLSETAAPSGYATRYFAKLFAQKYPALANLVGSGMTLGYTYNVVDGDVVITAVTPWDQASTQVLSVEVPNPGTTNISLKKVDDVGSDEGLSGAKFTVFYKNFDNVSGDLVVTLPAAQPTLEATLAQYQSWADGSLTPNMSGSQLNLNNRDPSVYVFVETTVPEGYELLKDDNGNVVVYTAVVTGKLPFSNVTVTPDSTTVDNKPFQTAWISQDTAKIEFSVPNVPMATLKAAKVASTGLLTGDDVKDWEVTLNLYDAATGGNKVGTITISKNNPPTNVYFKDPSDSTKNALFSVDKTYYLEEVVNVTDGSADAEHFVIVSYKVGEGTEIPVTPGSRYEVPVDSAQGFTITVTNQYLYGKVDFMKRNTDETADPKKMAGATFEVRHEVTDPDDPTQKKWELVPGSKVTDNGDGSYTANLPLDSASATTYRIYELTPPPGFVMNPDPEKNYIEVSLSAQTNYVDYRNSKTEKETVYNTEGVKLNLLKYDNIYGATTISPADGNARFAVYKWENNAWKQVQNEWVYAEADGADKQGKMPEFVMEPFATYALAEVQFDHEAYSGFDGYYQDGVKLPLQELTGVTVDDKPVYGVILNGTDGQGVTEPVTLVAYNVPKVSPTIEKKDVGKYPEGVYAQAKFSIYEVEADFVANRTNVEALLADETKKPVFTESTTGTKTFDDGLLGSTQQWVGNTPENSWNPAKTYLIVETEVMGSGGTYDTMVKDDRRVHWFVKTEPVADPDPKNPPVWTLENINGVADVTLKKEVDVNSVPSLLSGDRNVVYTITPTVTGKNQMLTSFVLTESGITAEPERATFDYDITNVTIGKASQDVKILEPEGTTETEGSSLNAKIKANIIFYSDLALSATAKIGEETVDVTDGPQSVPAPGGTKTFSIRYYSEEVQRARPGYDLGEEFFADPVTVAVTVDQIPAGSYEEPAVEITKFTNAADVELHYPKWGADGSAPQDQKEDDHKTVDVAVEGIKLPIVSVAKANNLEGKAAKTGTMVQYSLTFTNSASTGEQFHDPVLVDILPTGVKFKMEEPTYPVNITTGTQGEIIKLESILPTEGDVKQQVETTEGLYGDPETAVIFMMSGDLEPGSSVTVTFWAEVMASALLYERDNKVEIHNDVYLSSSKQSYFTENNRNGYSFAVSTGPSGYVWGQTLPDAAQDSSDPVSYIHEQGVEENVLNLLNDPNQIKFAFVRADNTAPVVQGATLGLSKGVYGDRDDGFHDTGLGWCTRTKFYHDDPQFEEGDEGWALWRLTINNGETEPATKLVIGDVIPKFGDDDNRNSSWNMIFDSFDVVKAKGQELTEGEDYTVWYYNNDYAEHSSDGSIPAGGWTYEAKQRVRTDVMHAREDNYLADHGWFTGLPASREERAKITAFMIVFNNEKGDLPGSRSMVVTYKTVVELVDEDRFNEIAFTNATNDFWIYYDELRPLSSINSNPVDVSLMDTLVQVEGDVWIDEDWDKTQEENPTIPHIGRRDYSEYAIINQLANAISFSITDKSGSGLETDSEDADHGSNTNPGYGESVRHFVFSNLFPAKHLDGIPLYINNELNVASLKGKDPARYVLNSALGTQSLAEIFKLTDLGDGHYMSDDPDHELTAGADNSLDSNFFGVEQEGAVSETQFTTKPFYIRYSDLWDQSKDIGFKMIRGLELTKLASDDSTVTIPGAKFSIYGPYEDTDLGFAQKTAAYPSAGLLKFTLDNGVYKLDPNGTETELVTGTDGKLKVTGLNWWKEYEIKEVDVPDAYKPISVSATGDSAANTRVVPAGDDSFMLKVPGKAKVTAMDKVTVTNPRSVKVQLDFWKLFESLSEDEYTFEFKLWLTGVLPTTNTQNAALQAMDPIQALQIKVRGDQVSGETHTLGSFDELTLYGVGTYTFKIEETEIVGWKGEQVNREATATVEVVWNDTDKKLEVQSITYSPSHSEKPEGSDEEVAGAKFVNKYNPDPVKLQVPVKKVITSDTVPTTDETFTFTIAAADQTNPAPLPDDPTVTITGAGEAYFGEIEYLKAGTYVYTVTETAGSNTHYNYDQSSWTVTVKVEDVQGVLKVTEYSAAAAGKTPITLTKDDLSSMHDSSNLCKITTPYAVVFDNPYTPEPVKLQIPVKKVISGDTVPTTDETFKFKIAAVGDAPLPKDGETTVTEVTVNGAGEVSFPNITYTEAGTYQYTVTEEPGSNNHYRYDQSSWAITVKVEDVNNVLKVTEYSATADGKTPITLTKDDLSSMHDSSNLCKITTPYAVVFDNPYTPDPVKLQIPVKKVISGDTVPTTDETFKFTIAAVGDAPLPKDGETTVTEVTVNGAGEVSFPNITYTEAGTYQYTVTEEPGTNSHYNYDSTSWTVTVKVEDVNNVLKVTEYSATADGKTPITLTKDDLSSMHDSSNLCKITTPYAVVFDNPYTPDPVKLQVPVKKVVTGDTVPTTDETFTFTIAAADTTDPAPLPDETTVTITGEGVAWFGAIEYLKAGTYVYTVTEKAGSNTHYSYDDSSWTVTVKVEDIQDVLKVTEYTVQKAGEEPVTIKGDALPHDTDNLCKPESDEIKVVFDNPYTPTPVKLQVPVKKVITGDTVPTTDETFTFTIAAADTTNPAPLPDPATVTIDGAGEAYFNAIEYLKAGTYVYTVKEEPGSNNHYRYDQSRWTVTVKVEDVQDELKVTEYTVQQTKVTVNPNGTTTEEVKDPVKISGTELKHDENNLCKPDSELIKVVFDNPYTPDPVRLQIPVKKVVSGSTKPTTPVTFTFTIAAADTTNPAPLPADPTVTITGEGEGWFNAIEYLKAGTYVYTVTEDSSSPDTHYNYDSSTWTVTVKVEDVKNVLKVTEYSAVADGKTPISLEKDDLDPMHDSSNLCKITTPYAVIFDNPYTPKPVKLVIPVEKKVPGNTEPEKDETFTFTIAAADTTDPAPLPDETTVTIKGEGKDWFNAIEYLKAGKYTYTVTETEGGNTHYDYSDEEWTVEVIVSNTDANELKITGYKVTTKDGTVVKQAINQNQLPHDNDNVCTPADTLAVVFENPYTPDPVKLVIPVQKVVTGDTKPTEPVSFNFMITPTYPSDAPMPKQGDQVKNTVSVTWDPETESGTGEFDMITYTKAGQYIYKVTELNGGNSAYTYDTTEWIVTVTVANSQADILKVVDYSINATQAEDGDLPHDTDNVCRPKAPKLAVGFNNPYMPKPVWLAIPVEKVVSGDTDPKQDETFIFTITTDDGSPLPTPDTSVQIVGEGSGTFNNIKYTRAGTYTYTVKEKAGSNTHYDYSDEEWTVKVTVSNTADDVLKVTGYEVNGQAATPEQLPHDKDNVCTPTAADLAVVFDNPYTPEPVKLVIPVKKEISGNNEPEKDEEFTFTIAAADEQNPAPLPADPTVIVKGASTGAFGQIEYKKAGTYTYTVKEIQGNNTHYTYSDEEWTVTVTVTNTAADILKVTGYSIEKERVTITAKSGDLPHDGNNVCTVAEAIAVVITNKYESEPVKLVIPAKKDITGETAPTKDEEFIFTISVADSAYPAPLPDDPTVTITGASTKYFGEIEYEKAGVYTYKVKETKGSNGHYEYSTEEWTVRVTVENTESDKLMVTAYTATNGKKTITLEKADLLPMHSDNLCTITAPANAVVITNPYEPDPVKLVIPAKKDVTGETAPKKDETFEFTLTAVDGAPVSKKATITVTGEGTEYFGEIEFKKAGKYTYKVKETAGSNTHYNYSDEEWTVEVTVSNTDADILKVTAYTATNGKMTVTLTEDQLAGMHDKNTNVCTITVPENAVVITNPYTPDPVKLKIPVEKKIPTETAPVTDEEFTFTITAVDGAPLPEKTTVTIKGEGKAEFDEIEYTKAGTYTYKVTEERGSNTHYEYSVEEWTVVVTVENTEADILKVTGYEVNGKKATADQLTHDSKNVCTIADTLGAIIFNNPYTPDPVKLKIPVEKKIPNETAPVTDETFTFTITAADGAPLPDPATVTITGEGKASFGEIEFKKAGTYTYTVKETKGSNVHYDYSEEEWTVVVKVENTEADILKVTGFETKAKNSGETKTATAEQLTHDSENVCTVADALGAVIFGNPYTPDPVELKIPVEKTISGDETPVKDTEFTFTITAADGAPLPGKTTVTIEGADKDYFDAIKFTKAGTYTYTIKETEDKTKHYKYSTAEWKIVVTVENTEADVLKVTGYKVNDTEATAEQLVHDDKNVCTVDKALAAVFDNEFNPPPAKLRIPVEKNFIIDAGVTSPNAKFEFELKAKDDEPMPSVTTVYTLGAGIEYFGEITFEKSGTYEYTVTELEGTEQGVTYDTTPRNVVVTVAVNSEDELEAHWTWAVDPEEPSAASRDTEVEVTNTYEVGKLIIKKTVAGNLGVKTIAFPFKVEFWDEQGEPITTPFKFSGSRTGNIRSGQTVSLRHGEYIIIEGIPVGTVYRVTETNSYHHLVTSTGSVGKIVANKTVGASFLNYRSNVPKTGETNLLPVTIPAMGVSGLGMILSALFGKKRKSRKSK